jgi:hypothetical protein
VNAVLSSIDNIIECLENRNYYTSVICFLEHSKAFDSVSHTILISKQAFFTTLITKVPHLSYDICIIEHNYFLLMIHYPRTAVLCRVCLRVALEYLLYSLYLSTVTQQHRKVIPDY